MLAILLLAVVVPCAYSLGVIAPLYYDPGGGCSRWSPISSAISAHPGTAFYLVINPSDGPGPVGSQPDQSYDECIPSLRPSSNPNTVVLGFVKILASKSSSAILAEINTYAGWSSSSRPTGIYFDGTSASTGTQYKTYVSHAKDKGFNFIILDPGDTPNSDFYSLADIVNTYEDRYSDFRTADLIISASAPASKQSVILSEAPQSGSYSAKISQLASVGVAAVYVTDLSNDESGIPQQWSAFVNDVAAVGGTSSAPSTASGSATPQSSGTTDTPNPSTSSPTSDAASKTSSPVGAIVGGILGAVIVILALMFYIMWRRRRRLSQTKEAPLDPFTFRQQPTLIQLVEKLPLSSARTVSDAGTNPFTTQPSPTSTNPSSPQTPSSASNYGGGTGIPSEKRSPTAARVSNRASTRTGTSAGTSQRLSLDPPPAYWAPSTDPV